VLKPGGRKISSATTPPWGGMWSDRQKRHVSPRPKSVFEGPVGIALAGPIHADGGNGTGPDSDSMPSQNMGAATTPGRNRFPVPGKSLSRVLAKGDARRRRVRGRRRAVVKGQVVTESQGEDDAARRG